MISEARLQGCEKQSWSTAHVYTRRGTCMQEQEISEGLLATVVINEQHYRGALDAVRCR